MIDTIDIASYADDNTPYSVGKNQDLKKNCKRHQLNYFVNGYMRMI